MRYATTILIAIAVALLLTACSSAPTGKATQTEPVKLGVIGPFTGDAAAYGIPYRQSIDLAVEEINKEGGINGRPLQVIYEDGTCNAKGATTAAQKLISVDGVKVILGGFCSGETLGAAPVAESNKVILFSAGSGSPDITKAGDYVFRNFPSDATSGSKIAQTAVANGHKRIAIISEQTDYAQAIKGVFNSRYESLGGEIVADETYTSDANDFRAALTKIKYSDPDAVYVLAQTPAKFGLVTKQLREMQISEQMYTNEFAAAEEILKDYPTQIEGAIYAEPAFDESSPQTQELFSKFRAKYGQLPQSLPPVYVATTYDAINILRDEMAACGDDNECIKEKLYAIKDRNGTAGSLSIDSNGDAQIEYVVKTVHDGKTTAYQR